MAKKKILLLSDDLRMSSGVGTMSKCALVSENHAEITSRFAT